MKDLQKKLRVALVQATPVMFDKDATIDKVCAQIREAGQNGAELIVFPESLIPCYPLRPDLRFYRGAAAPRSAGTTGKSTMTTPFSAPARTPTASARQRKRRALTSPSAIQSGAATTAPSTALI